MEAKKNIYIQIIGDVLIDSSKAFSQLESQFIIHYVPEITTNLKQIAQINILIISYNGNFSNLKLKHYENLQIIASVLPPSYIEKSYIKNKGIQCIYPKFGPTRSVVELILGVAIFFLRNTFEGIKSENCFELRGKTIGIIGYGNIGSQLSVIMESLGGHVIYYDSAIKLPLGNARFCTEISELLSKADIISLNASESENDTLVINNDELTLLKSNCILIDYSNLKPVDVNFLKERLMTKKLGALAIDTTDFEYYNNLVNLFDGHRNVSISFNKAGFTSESRLRSEQEIIENIMLKVDKLFI